ncbi:unnamed protein product [Sphagnum balticum]
MVGATDVSAWAHLLVSDCGIDQLEHVLHGSSHIRAVVAHDIQQFRQHVQSHPLQMLEKGFSNAPTNATSTCNVDDGQQQALRLSRDNVNPMNSHDIKPFQVAVQHPSSVNEIATVNEEKNVANKGLAIKYSSMMRLKIVLVDGGE